MAKKANFTSSKTELLIKSHIEKINAHLGSYKIPATLIQKVRNTNALCVNYNKAKPIIDLLGLILGKSVGSAIIAISNGINEYCNADSIVIPTPADIKAKSKAVAAICKAWQKFSPVIALAIMIFASNPGWSQALKALSASLNSLCADPV